MTAWGLASIIVLLGGFIPGTLLGSRGGPTDRLVGLELTGAVAVVLMLMLTYVYGQSGYVIVPLVLTLLSVAGVLVFTRLLGPRR